ncbi:MAG: DUF4382 domain-containing protein [Bacteroidia bacterium]
MKTNVKILTAIFIGCSLVLSDSCKKSDNGAAPSSATYNMYMTDSPGDYEAVYVNIVGAQAFSNGGWVNLNVNAGIYNLLSLSNGKDTIIATGAVAAGNVTQVRLILGATGNTVVTDNGTFTLSTSSTEQGGLTLQVQSQVAAGTTYNLTIDFDAGMSVVYNSNNTYTLKPVLRVIVPPVNGSISGTITPVSAQAAVLAISASSDSTFSFSSTLSGNFMVQGLSSGVYQVVIIPKPPFSIKTYTGVMVNQGYATSMGTITFN